MASVNTAKPSGNLNNELQSYWNQFEALKKEAQLLAKDLTFYQFNWSPVAERWSIAECLDHINITGHKSIPTIEALINQARTQKLTSDGPFRHGWIGNMIFVKFNEPPPKIRVKTSKNYRPSGSRFVNNVIQDFLYVQNQLQILIHSSNGLDIAKVKAPSPTIKTIKLSLGQWYAFLAAHARRHVWQARQILQTASFPPNE
ncbi:MAG TPA: DinB family protein [Blastocatellia bacterium]|nr:DinB family protein [Blastocatellia bacterium]